MRVVLELRKDAIAEVILNNLYKYTQLQDTFGIYNLALVNKQPTLLTLKKLIELYLEHRIEVIRRRTEFELKKAKARMHILEGLRIAQQNIDEVVRIIRASQDTDIAKISLIERFDLSEIQAQSIVDMRLRQLTNLEIDKIENEYQELVITAADLEDILAKRERQLEIILNRLDEINDKFGDERRTSIRSEEHTSELQSRPHLVCRLLLEKKKKKNNKKQRESENSDLGGGVCVTEDDLSAPGASTRELGCRPAT